MQDVIRSIKAKKGTLLDVRTRSEFEEQHLPGAVNIPLDTLASQIDQVENLEKPVLVYCLSGGRSGMATGILQQQGVDEVYNGGGIYTVFSMLGEN